MAPLQPTPHKTSSLIGLFYRFPKTTPKAEPGTVQNVALASTFHRKAD
jgi:hypothetical protein